MGRRGGGRGAGGLGIGGLDSASGGDDWLAIVMGVEVECWGLVGLWARIQVLVNDMLAALLAAHYIWLNVCCEPSV